jgi:hypothetical protein
MAVLEIFSPGYFYGGVSGTQFVGNPWGSVKAPDSSVWIQCTMPWSEIWDTAEVQAWGILEIEFLDEAGQFQQTQFGDPTNLNSIFPDQLPPRLFVQRFLGATFALLNFNATSCGTVTLFLWG